MAQGSRDERTAPASGARSHDIQGEGTEGGPFAPCEVTLGRYLSAGARFSPFQQAVAVAADGPHGLLLLSDDTARVAAEGPDAGLLGGNGRVGLIAERVHGAGQTAVGAGGRGL